MIFKSYILEQNNKEITKFKGFLFYGENLGLQEEFKEILKKLNKDKEILNFVQDDIIKNKEILTNEIRNKSLFDKEKIIFINEGNDKIVETIKSIEEIIQDEKIYIFSSILEKKSKLRSYFEKSKVFGIVACYKDNEIALKKIIIDKMNEYKGLTPQIINLIIDTTNQDRNKINNEIQKIKNCFQDKILDKDKIDLLLNVTSNDDFNQLKDTAIKGNKVKTNKLLADTIFDEQSCVYYLNIIYQRINKLKEIQELRKNENTNVELLVSSLKPPVFWKDKPILIDQLKKWDKGKIETALNNVYETELKIKSNSSIKKDLLIKNLLVELCKTANAA